MAKFVKGDVVVLPFPFSNLRASKKRPALVIASADPHHDLILCMITSKATGDVNSIPIIDQSFVEGGLPVESNVRPNRLFTADAGIIIRLAGKLSSVKVEEVADKIIQIVST